MGHSKPVTNRKTTRVMRYLSMIEFYRITA
jgi:hypothetical protein